MKLKAKLQAAQAKYQNAWKLAGDFDGIPTASVFSVFSKENPHAEAVNKTSAAYLKLMVTWQKRGQ
jgi:hypothetical protein